MLVRINPNRLKDTFIHLASIESPSRKEGKIAHEVSRIFSQLDAQVSQDASTDQTGSEVGNLIIRVSGTKKAEPVFFNAHLDTVMPCSGIKVLFRDGVFRSDGKTILGADDKAAVAILIEVIQVLRDHGIEHGPVELVLTVCEEIGLLGAKAFDPENIRARCGYALDSIDPEVLIHQAPCATRFNVTVKGRAAHAGINPEEGINAILVASQALANLPSGRIDPDTTANIGIIKGGKATNIVPDEVEIQGEVRSHQEERLRQVQDQILSAFHKVAMKHRPRDPITKGCELLPLVQTQVYDDYPLMSVSAEHPVVTKALSAAKELGRQLRLERTGGGSDANVFNGKGLATVIMGIGMQKVHTTEEFIRLDDMVRTAELVLAIIRTWAQ